MQDFPSRHWISPLLADEEGLVGIGGDLSTKTLLAAYTDGVFPWYCEGDPILWWSPDPRGVLDFHELHIPRSLRKTIRQMNWEFRVDTAFAEVLKGCSQREDGTWITEDMFRAYCRLHQNGIAHSGEVWDGNRLIGGIYGVCLNGFFSAESMFFREPDASKVALIKLVEHLQKRNYTWMDIQILNDHTQRFGGKNIPRTEYLLRIRQAMHESLRFS